MNPSILLPRDQFRELTFERDGYKCVVCGAPAVDAHHIMERRLFPDGGYYLGNGASVCEVDHIRCETTEISLPEIRTAAGIERPVIPPHLYPDQEYDKWGNPVMANGTRLRGDLFYDESVQKILTQGGMLHLFTDRVKYPRTHHLPWSGNINSDDRIIESLAAFQGQRVIVTRKMDGENSTLYPDYFHARSIDSRNHPSRSMAKSLWAAISGDIPAGHRICAENLYAKHSIRYDDLPSYLIAFSMWDDRNVCMDWDETRLYFELIGLHHVDVMYDGVYDEALVRDLADQLDPIHDEGFVMRVAGRISYSEFKHKVAKYVRKGHIQTVKHWMHGQPIEPNGLRK